MSYETDFKAAFKYDHEKAKTSNDSNYSDGYKENWLFMVARYLHFYGDDKYSKLYSEAGYKYMIKINIMKSLTY